VPPVRPSGWPAPSGKSLRLLESAGGDDINAGSDTPGLFPGKISHLVDNEGLLA